MATVTSRPPGLRGYDARWSDDTGTALAGPDGSIYRLSPGSSAGRRVAIFGDSITVGAFSVDRWLNWGGYGTWLRRYLGHRIDLPSSRVFGAGGATIAQLRDTYLPLALASDCDIVIVHAGLNSLGVDVPTMIEQMQSIYTAFLKKGIAVVAIPIRVCGVSQPVEGDALKRMLRFNRWITEFANANRGVVVCDVNPLYLDFATGNAKSGMLRDDVHDSVLGAMTMGRAVADTLAALLPPSDQSFMHLGDVWDATINPTGNLLTNGLMSGTTGTEQNGATGNTPTGWTSAISGSTTVTMAMSEEADATYTNLKHSRMTIGGTADSKLVNLLQSRTLVDFNLSPLDYVEMCAEVDYDFDTNNFNSIYCAAVVYNSVPTIISTAYDGYYESAHGNMPIGTGSLVLKSPVFQLPATASIVTFSFGVYPGSSGTLTGTVDWKRAYVRKVIV